MHHITLQPRLLYKRLTTAPSLRSSASWCSVLPCPRELLAFLRPYITIHPPKWAPPARAVLCEQEVSSLREKSATELLFHMTPSLHKNVKITKQWSLVQVSVCFNGVAAWLRRSSLCLVAAFAWPLPVPASLQAWNTHLCSQRTLHPLCGPSESKNHPLDQANTQYLTGLFPGARLTWAYSPRQQRQTSFPSKRWVTKRGQTSPHWISRSRSSTASPARAPREEQPSQQTNTWILHVLSTPHICTPCAIGGAHLTLSRDLVYIPQDSR